MIIVKPVLFPVLPRSKDGGKECLWPKSTLRCGISDVGLDDQPM
jgi:hypothetical protein